MNPLVSIVIPCYNAELFIVETLSSIIIQEGVRFEIIIIDDGSTDNTKNLVKSFSNIEINYFYQLNKGVSSARNNGIDKATGDYIIFFDADDIMPPNFILSRLKRLMENDAIDFISGEVKKFNTNGFIGDNIKGPDSNNLENQILMYDAEIAACPANIMLKHDFLKRNKIKFNEQLSSTADRYFLLECNWNGKVKFYSDVVPLHYRVFDQSMSNHLTYSLVRDNERYYKILKKSNLLPKEIRKKCIFLGYFILFGSYWKLGKVGKAIEYGIKCFFSNPISFFGKLFN